MAFPSLREELALLPGPSLADGQPSWSLHDPIRNQFFRIDWQSFEILSRWQMANSQAIAEDICQSTTLQLEPEDVDAFIQFLGDNQLLHEVGTANIRKLTSRLEAVKGNWKQWLLHHYLFFRVPIVKPDNWLNDTAKYVQFFFSPLFFKLTIAALMIGLIEVARDWERFHSTLVDMFSWHGLVSYGMALVVVKVLHELGHAYTAKRFHCRVPVMGVAFLILLPVAYTDTNEVWKLTDRRQRLKVAAAGVITELTIAAWATLAWAFLPVGDLKSIAFILATTSWVATLAINVNPFMRFDGYFLLSDWLDMPNLHTRAFALARWSLREYLFDLGEPPPEYFSRKRTRWLIIFAYATWAYRLILFFAIAALVYSFFIKVVGIFLFIVEIVWFVLMPLYGEFKVWRQKWPLIRQQSQSRRSLFVCLILLLLISLPWPSRVVTSGVIKPEKVFAVYAPAGAQLVANPWKEGAIVNASETILTLAAPELTKRWNIANAYYIKSKAQLESATVDADQRPNLQVLQQAVEVAQSELDQVKADMTQYAPIAPFTGALYYADPDLDVGGWVKYQEKLATLVSKDKWIVETYLDEEVIRRIAIGDSALFMSDGRGQSAIKLTVVDIDQDATRTLPSALLSTPAGGSVMVREQNGQWIPEVASYRVLLSVKGDVGELNDVVLRGQVIIRGNWAVPLMRYIRSALTLIWREAGV
jgi:putative peptide zinc metalloprotease protein